MALSKDRNSVTTALTEFRTRLMTPLIARNPPNAAIAEVARLFIEIKPLFMKPAASAEERMALPPACMAALSRPTSARAIHIPRAIELYEPDAIPAAPAELREARFMLFSESDRRWVWLTIDRTDFVKPPTLAETRIDIFLSAIILPYECDFRRAYSIPLIAGHLSLDAWPVLHTLQM